MKIIVTTVLLAISVTAGALDLKGVSPGQPWEPQVIQDKLNANGPDLSNPVNRALAVKCSDSSCYGWAVFGNCSGNVMVVPKNDRTIEKITVQISINCYDATVALMMKKFGPASRTLTQVKQNAFGAKVDDVILIWSSADQSLIYEKYEEMTQSIISLSGPQKPEKEGTL